LAQPSGVRQFFAFGNFGSGICHMADVMRARERMKIIASRISYRALRTLRVSDLSFIEIPTMGNHQAMCSIVMAHFLRGFTKLPDREEGSSTLSDETRIVATFPDPMSFHIVDLQTECQI
jgi:hypothetical protein